MLRAYFAAGCPDLGLRPWGSYEDWSRVVRGAVVFSGFADPIEARAAMPEATSAARSALPELLAAWARAFADGRPRRAREIVDTMLHEPERLRELRGAVVEMCSLEPGQVPSPKALGKALAKVRGVVVRGWHVAGVQDADGITFWSVRGVPGSAGSGLISTGGGSGGPACTTVDGGTAADTGKPGNPRPGETP